MLLPGRVYPHLQELRWISTRTLQSAPLSTLVTNDTQRVSQNCTSQIVFFSLARRVCHQLLPKEHSSPESFVGKSLSFCGTCKWYRLFVPTKPCSEQQSWGSWQFQLKDQPLLKCSVPKGLLPQLYRQGTASLAKELPAVPNSTSLDLDHYPVVRCKPPMLARTMVLSLLLLSML